MVLLSAGDCASPFSLGNEELTVPVDCIPLYLVFLGFFFKVFFKVYQIGRAFKGFPVILGIKR